jgi:hypothetical protein
MANNVTDGSAISTGAARLAEAASNAAAKGKELTSTGTANQMKPPAMRLQKLMTRQKMQLL